MTALAVGFLLLLLLPMNEAAGQRVETGFLDRSVELDGRRYRYQVYVPAGYAGGDAWPVILSLHGSGERGADGMLQTAIGLGAAIRRDPARWPAIVVFPQAPADARWVGSTAAVAMAALDATLLEFRTDASRVYLTGLSMGGHGAWYLAYRHAGRFAAAAVVCGWVEPLPNLPTAETVVPAADGEPFAALARRLAPLPVWIVHGEIDAVVPVEQSRRAAEALRAAGGDARYTELIGVAHNAWDPAYGSPALADWLFRQRRR
jgi:predicted peptidase